MISMHFSSIEKKSVLLLKNPNKFKKKPSIPPVPYWSALMKHPSSYTFSYEVSDDDIFD
jgi:hypothetical protein